MNHCSVSGNNAPQGGGIQSDNTLNMNNCTVSNNTSPDFAAGIKIFGCSTTLTNCTISNNISGGDSGGIEGHSCGTLTLTNCTVTYNRSVLGAGRSTGGGLSVGGSTTLKNTIVANNTGAFPNISGTVDIATSSNNLIGVGGLGGLTNGTNGNITGVQFPLLETLADNGGFTQTIALLPCSPAINAGTGMGAPATDQRDLARVGTTDIGAYEFQSAPPAAVTPTITANGPTSCGGSNGSIVLGGFFANTTYSLTYKKNMIAVDAANFTTNDSGLLTLNNLSAGSYTDMVATYGTCVSNAAMATLSDPTAPASPTASVTVQPNCTTTMGTIVVTAPSGENIQYSIGGEYQPSPIFSGLMPNTYSVTAKNTNTGCISAPLSLTVNPSASSFTLAFASKTHPTLCQVSNGSLTFTTNGLPNGNYTLNYSDGAAKTATVIVNNNQFTLTGLRAGSYANFSLTNSECTGSDASTQTLSDPAAPNAGTISGAQPICGTSTLLLTTNGDTGGTWSSSDLNIATVNPSTGAVLGVGSGQVQILYRVVSGECASSTSVLIRVSALPTLTATGTLLPNSRCPSLEQVPLNSSVSCGGGKTVVRQERVLKPVWGPNPIPSV